MTAFDSDVVLAREGDDAAYTRLVELSAGTVCSIALAIVRNVEASEDIAQEVFVAAWKNLGRLRNPASFLPWLRQMTRNQARTWNRDRRREVTDDAATAAAVDSRPLAEDRLVDDEERRLVAEVLEQLPDDAREVLILYYREERSTRQVAQLLEISEDAARQRLSRSRAILREETLKRFERTVKRTAPGAAFASAVAGALTFATPSASAAILASAATKGAVGGKTAMAAGALVGGALGWVGVLMGMMYLEPVFDEQEARALRRFRNVALLVVTLGGLWVAATIGFRLRALIAIQSLYAALFYLYLVRLPRILERRMLWEQSVNPEAAKQSRRRWIWATVGQALGAATGGAVIMAIVLKWMTQ